MWETNVIDVSSSWYMLSFSAKWLGEKSVKTYSLDQYRGYKQDRENDFGLVGELWKLFDQADIVIAHNGDSFDIKKSNARFIFHGLNPPSTYKSIDTLKIARRHFQLESNRLGDLGVFLGLGDKVPTTGKDTWLRCMDGDLVAWNRIMKPYNKRDVDLLEKVYERLRAWNKSHPDLRTYTGEDGCPTCSSPNVQHRGFNVAKTRRTQRMHCQACGAWFSGRAA